MSDDKNYRVTVKIRNNNLLTAIEKSGNIVGVKFCEMVGIKYQALNDLINMKRAPVDSNGELIEQVVKICVYLNKMPSELFDFDQMHNTIEKNTAEFSADFEDIAAISNSNDPDLFELKLMFSRHLSSLNDRSADMVRMHYGIDCGEHTFEEIAGEYGISKERSRQIICQAMRKIRGYIYDENGKKMSMLKVSNYIDN